MTSWMRLLQQVIDRANKIAWDRANIPQAVKPYASSKPPTVPQPLASQPQAPPPPPPPPPPYNENSQPLSNTLRTSEVSLASTWKDTDSGRSSRANTFTDSPIPVHDGTGTGTGHPSTGVLLASFSSVGVWLDSMELRQYEPIFEARGYDNVETVLGTGLRDDFLDTIGIVDPYHRSILQTSGIQSYCDGLKVTVSKWRVFGPIVVFTGESNQHPNTLHQSLTNSMSSPP